MIEKRRSGESGSGNEDKSMFVETLEKTFVGKEEDWEKKDENERDGAKSDVRMGAEADEDAGEKER